MKLIKGYIFVNSQLTKLKEIKKKGKRL